MTEHYYTQNPNVAHDEKQVIFEALGLKLASGASGAESPRLVRYEGEEL